MAKNQLNQYKIVNAVSMGADITSSPVNIKFLDNISIELDFTGTPTGTFQIQGSVSYNQSVPMNVQDNAGFWVPITLPTSPVASGAAGQILIDMNQLSFPWIRVVYVRTSGTGTLTGWISAKSV